ncbi:MAG: cation-transporting P-type ATPase, partial [Myxococcales bacterium]
MIAQAGDGPLPAYRRPVAEVVAALSGDAQRGLEPEAIAERLRRYGRNELPAPPK